MKFLRNIAILILLAVMGIVAGDYFNMPLWPVDWLKTSYPVEVTFKLNGVSNENALTLFQKSKFSEISLCKPDGTFIRTLPLDKRGVSRFVIQQGKYSVKAIMASVDAGEWCLFSTALDAQGFHPSLEIDFAEQEFSFLLNRKTELEDQSKQNVLMVYLQEGDLESSQIVASDLSQDIQTDIQRLQTISNELRELPVGAYNSIVRQLQEASDLLGKYGIHPGERVFQQEKDVLHIESRLNAVRRARNMVIESYVEMMSEFQKSGRLMSVLQEWNQMMGNPELSDLPDDLPQSLQDSIAEYEVVVEEVRVLLPDEVDTNYNQGITLYQDGKLIEAREKLTRLLSFIRNLNLEDEYKETESTAIEYLQDIEIITTANHAIRSDRPEHALELLEMIVHPNALVQEQINETQRFLQIRSGKVQL